MALINVERSPYSSEVTEALLNAAHYLERIALALERLSPVLPEAPVPRVAGLGDLRHTDASSLSSIHESLERYAQEHNVALNSDAFLRSIHEYEQQVGEAYGQDAIFELPWNKAAGGALFKDYSDKSNAKAKDEGQDHQGREVPKGQTPQSR
jgi:hypothetical protein